MDKFDKMTRKKCLPLIALTIFMIFQSLASVPPVLAAETTNSVSIGFSENLFVIENSLTVNVTSGLDLEVRVETGCVFSMPATISITTDNELISPTTQSITVTLSTENAHFQLNFKGDLTVEFSGVYSGYGGPYSYSFADLGFDNEFNPLESVTIGTDFPLLSTKVTAPVLGDIIEIELGARIDVDIDAFVTADLYRGTTFLENMRWDDSGETKSLSYSISEVTASTSGSVSVENIAWNYDLTLNTSFYAKLKGLAGTLAGLFGVPTRYDIPTTPPPYPISISLPSVTVEEADTASVSYTTWPSDADNDNMLGTWELQYGLNPNDPNDASQDKDGDGYTNLQEYQAGTDPTLASSYPGATGAENVSGEEGGLPAMPSPPTTLYNTLLIIAVIGVIVVIGVVALRFVARKPKVQMPIKREKPKLEAPMPKKKMEFEILESKEKMEFEVLKPRKKR